MGQAQVAVTQYCERVGDGFWAEPINAITNLAFLLAAAVLVYTLRRTDSRFLHLWDLWLLVGLLVAVGLGSFLWHTLATPWSEWADVVPILLFINVFVLSFLVRVVQLKLLWVLFWFSLYHIINFGIQLSFPPDFLNGSIFYLPTWASLLIMALYCWQSGRAAASLLFIATFVFTISLLMRTLDSTLCAAWPLGTHFGWHLFNALTLYLVTRVLLPDARPAAHPGSHLV